MRRFEALQERFAAGESLSPAEELERRELAGADPLALRELQIFDELRARLDADVSLAPEVVDGALAAAGARPHLAVVGAPAGREAPQADRGETRGRARSVATVASAGVLAAAAAAVVLSQSERPGAIESAAAPAPAPVTPSRAELVLASGSVDVSGNARVGASPLAAGDRIATHGGRACLTIDPGIDVCMGEASSLLLESLAPSDVRVRVESGTAFAALARRKPGHAFALHAGPVSAAARGTVFAVQHGGPRGKVDVVVMEGVVEVTSHSASERVEPHSRVSLDPAGRLLERAQVGRGEEARFWALGAARELWTEAELGVLWVPATGAASVAVDDEAPLSLPLRVFVPAGQRRIAVTWPGGERTTGEVSVTAGESLTFDASPPERAASDAKATTSPEALLAAARHELAQGNPGAALSLYEKLRSNHPRSPEAFTVLVTIGKLELDLKRPARALANFDAYARRGGPLAQEALAGKIRALKALDRTADERRAIALYLERYPRGFDAPNLERRLEAIGP